MGAKGPFSRDHDLDAVRNGLEFLIVDRQDWLDIEDPARVYIGDPEIRFLANFLDRGIRGDSKVDRGVTFS